MKKMSLKNKPSYTIFNRNLYKESMRQLRLIGLIATALLMLWEVLIPVGKYTMITAETHLPVVLTITSNYFCLIFSYTIIVPVLALTAFNFMTKRMTSDYYHSFPQTRKCIFLTIFAAVMTWITIAIFVPAISSLLICKIMSKYLAIDGGHLLLFCLSMLICSFLVAAAITLSCSITGTLFTNICVTGIILFLPRILTTAICTMITSSSILLDSDNLITLLANKYNIVFNTIYGIFYSSTPAFFTSASSMTYTFILGVIFFAVSIILFTRRKSELAGNAATSKHLQTSIRMCVALPLCLAGCDELFNIINNKTTADRSDIFALFVIYLLAVIAMFVYELLATKKFKNVIKSLPSVIYLAVLNVLIIGFSCLIYNVQVNYCPDASDIQYISLNNDIDDMNYFEQMLTKVRYTDDDFKQFVSKQLKQTIELEKKSNDFVINDTNSSTVKLNIKSGLTVKTRTIVMNKKENAEYDLLINHEEIYNKIYTNLPDYPSSKVTLNCDNISNNNKDIAALYKTLKEEYKSLSYADIIDNMTTAHQNISMTTTFDDTYCYTFLPIWKKTPKTLAMYYNLTNRYFKESNKDNSISYLFKTSFKNCPDNQDISFVLNILDDTLNNNEQEYSFCISAYDDMSYKLEKLSDYSEYFGKYDYDKILSESADSPAFIEFTSQVYNILNNPDNYNDITSLEKPGCKPAKISYNYYDTKASTYKCYELNFFISENELSDLNSIH